MVQAVILDNQPRRAMPHILETEYYKDQCPIWGTPAHLGTPSQQSQYVDSPRTAGEFTVSIWSKHGHKMIRMRDNKHRAILTTMIIEQREKTGEAYIYDGHIQDAAKRDRLPVRERANRLLKYLAGRSEEKLIGYRLHINSDSLQQELLVHNNNIIDAEKYKESVEIYYGALAWSESSSWQELLFLIKQLSYANLLEIFTPNPSGEGLSCQITHAGYQKIEQITVNKDSSQAFVAMWFGNKKEGKDEMDKLYTDGIEKAVKNTGYKPMRIDKKPDLNKIDDEIIAEIRRSHFLIADYTHGSDGPRGGVYYEAGFAHGLDIPVIRSHKSGLRKSIHFDTRQYFHIEWETPEDLRVQLEHRILSVIGRGPIINEAGS